MPQEIEHKFLVHDLPNLNNSERVELQQVYLAFEPSLRVRIADDAKGYLTIKGKGHLERAEYDYEIPLEDARELFETRVSHIVEKTRFKLPADEPGLTWEIDVYRGRLQGLIVAEVELPHRDHPFAHPEWLGEDVTEDPRYKNSSLSKLESLDELG